MMNRGGKPESEAGFAGSAAHYHHYHHGHREFLGARFREAGADTVSD